MAADVEQIEPQEQDEEVVASTEDATTDEAPEGAEADGQDPTPDEQPVVEGSGSGAEPPAEAAEEEAQPEPFSYTADRRRFEVPGAAIVKFTDDDGKTVEKIVMDRDAFARFVQPQLRDGPAVHKRELELKRQITGLDPERNETVIRARALLGSLEDVLKDEDSLTAFLSNFNQNKELWSLKAEKAVADAKLTGYTTQESEAQQTARTEEAASQVMADIPSTVAGAAEFVTQNWKIAVDQRAIQAAQQQISENIGAYYRYATAHDAQTHGVEEGQLIRDDDAVIRTIHRFATLLSQQSTVETVKAKNQQALGDGKKPPKTVSAKGSPGAAEKPKSFKNKDEWRKHMGLNT